MKILVSACLVGENCKYNAGNNLCERVVSLSQNHTLIPVCPEMMGGLPSPRPSCEIVSGIVTSTEGKNVDAEFRRGAEAALLVAKQNEVDLAVLQPRSPSCGVHMIYDGTFSGGKIPGSGVFATLLKENGFRAVEPQDLDGLGL